MKITDGIIIKGIGGFYYVETADKVYECKARGVFRKNKITPLVGDRADITINDNAENTIDGISERKNSLNRPPVANIDNLLIVVSTVEPKPNFLVIDKLTAVAENKRIEPVIIISKNDLKDGSGISDIYRKAGFMVFSSNDESDLLKIKSVMKGKINALTGNSGVGKSTLINRLEPSVKLSTGEISAKLGRGRHTTRQAELFKICSGYVIDTPGFSSFELGGDEAIKKDDLQYCFREFLPFIGTCRFSTCSHVKDKGCKICEAVEEGLIEKSRHENYCVLYEQAKNLKEWEL